MKLAETFTVCLGVAVSIHAQVSIEGASGWLESAFAEWSADGSDSYDVYYSGAGLENVKVDAQLVRRYGRKYRVDVPGLKAGDYTLKIIPVKGGKEGAASLTANLKVEAHDRSGFAFVDGCVPGAYTADGLLKDGAVVVYVSESNKDSVSLDVVADSKGTLAKCVGLQGILNGFKKGYDKRPLDIRLLGNITDPALTDKGDVLVDLGKKETSFLTIEGVGNDAVANGWGIRVKNAQNVEIRNIGIMNVDSDEGDGVGLQQDNRFVWVHNCDFFYGDAGSDADQAKGDGALDCKKSTYVTFSYNHFWDNGKSNLLGLSEGTTEGLFITYHHNWYDHSDSRHPRVRFYSAHVYNNYYDGNSKYGMGATKGASVFSEGNYFRNCKYPMMTSMQGSDVYAGGNVRDAKNNPTFSSEDGGSIKAFNNFFEGTYTFIPYGAGKYNVKGVLTEASSQGVDPREDFDAYVVEKREDRVPAEVKSFAGQNVYNNFDTDEFVMYAYKADAPEVAKKNVIAYAGRCQGGDFKWKFDNAVDDASAAVNAELKMALVAYAGGSGEVDEYDFPAENPAELPAETLDADSAEVPVEEPPRDSFAPSVVTPAVDSVESDDVAVVDSIAADCVVEKTQLPGVSANAFGFVRFESREKRLVVPASVVSVKVVRMDGSVVDYSTVVRSGANAFVDLSFLQTGVYFARVAMPGFDVQRTICIK